VVFGGNTPCVQVQIGERLIILDAGSGIYHLGQELLRAKGRVSGDIFITHTHWDHIHGFPFFAPAFDGENRFVLYGQGKTNATFADLMRHQMTHPHFPVQLNEMGAHIDFVEIDSGETICLGEIKVSAMHNNHPNGSLSYRVDYGNKSCCYLTDTEHYSCVDPYLKDLIHDADLVIYDSNFTDEEYRGDAGFPPRVGWGHSTWQEGIKLVEAAEAKKLVLFHHAMYRSDQELEAIERQARERYADCLAAREGMVISL
jgi:phosphoribosyl 1,2-cyclic phosphodiesterase